MSGADQQSPALFRLDTRSATREEIRKEILEQWWRERTEYDPAKPAMPAPWPVSSDMQMTPSGTLRYFTQADYILARECVNYCAGHRLDQTTVQKFETMIKANYFGPEDWMALASGMAAGRTMAEVIDPLWEVYALHVLDNIKLE